MKIFVKKVEAVDHGHRTIVSALFVEQDAIYCACKVVKESSHKIFTLHKYKHNGMFEFYIEGFNHIRGIAKDSDGNLYVSDSFGHQVIKFDNNGNPMRKTHQLASETTDTSYGLYLDENVVEDIKERNIYLCSKDKICILDEQLTILYSLKLKFCPLDITKFGG